jgi:hypothetical protein
MPTPKFKPGQSGNPKGRTPGKSPLTALRKSISKDIDKVIQTVLAQALEGDMQACKILLDRVCPALKPQALPISLPINGSLSERGDEVIKATMAGQIPPDVGAQLITALAKQGKLIELDELDKRLTALESRK